MINYNDLDPDKQKELQNTLKKLTDISSVYIDFPKEVKDASKPKQELVNNFDNIFSVAKKYGIGHGAFVLDSVQKALYRVAGSIKDVAVHLNAPLHQVFDDITTVANDFTGEPKQWINNPSGVAQDGECLKSDVDETKRCFGMKP